MDFLRISDEESQRITNNIKSSTRFTCSRNSNPVWRWNWVVGFPVLEINVLFDKLDQLNFIIDFLHILFYLCITFRRPFSTPNRRRLCGLMFSLIWASHRRFKHVFIKLPNWGSKVVAWHNSLEKKPISQSGHQILMLIISRNCKLKWNLKFG